MVEFVWHALQTFWSQVAWQRVSNHSLAVRARTLLTTGIYLPESGCVFPLSPLGGASVQRQVIVQKCQQPPKSPENLKVKRHCISLGPGLKHGL